MENCPRNANSNAQALAETHSSETGYAASAKTTAAIRQSRADISLREQLSEKELELLEMRSTAMQEASYLRSTLRKREMDILEREASVRQLKLKLQQEQGQLALEKTKHESRIHHLTSQVQTAVKEINRFREKVHRAEVRRAQTKQVRA